MDWLGSYFDLLVHAPLLFADMGQTWAGWLFGVTGAGLAVGVATRADPEWLGRILGTMVVAAFLVYGVPPVVIWAEVPLMPSVVLMATLYGLWLALEALAVLSKPILEILRWRKTEAAGRDRPMTDD